MSDFIIQYQNLSLYKKGKQILYDITLEMVSGKSYLLFGRNGAGKSSLIKCLLGFDKQFEGEILVHHKNTTVFNGVINKTFLPEELEIPPQINVQNYIQSFLEIYSKMGRLNNGLFKELSDKFGIHNFCGKHFGELSKGMKKSILLVLALTIDADLIVLDEPLEGLDVINKEILVDFLTKETSKGKLIIVSSHEVARFFEEFDGLISIKEGRITNEIKNSGQLDYSYLLNQI